MFKIKSSQSQIYRGMALASIKFKDHRAAARERESSEIRLGLKILPQDGANVLDKKFTNPPQEGANVLFFTFINPATMEVPLAFQKLGKIMM